MKLIRQPTTLGVCWKTLAVFLVGLYFSASTLTAFPSLHNHSKLSAFGTDLSHVSHGNSEQDGSKSGKSGSHGHENCQICHIQSALADSFLSSGPSFSLALLVQSYLRLHSSPSMRQLQVAELHSRGPPLLPSL